MYIIYNEQYVSCECKDGFIGITCEQKLSCGNCDNLQCEGNTKCKSCPKGWKGNQCIERDCNGLNMCGTNGRKLYYRSMYSRYSH